MQYDKDAPIMNDELLHQMEQIAEYADNILADNNEYFDMVDSKMEQTLARVKTLVEDMPTLSPEEVSMDCYSCFIKLTRLSVLFQLYVERNALYFTVGREEMEEVWYKDICDLLHLFRESEAEFNKKRVEDGGQETLMKVDTAFDYGVEWAQKAEAMMRQNFELLYGDLKGKDKLSYNLKAMQQLIDVGMTPEQLDMMGVNMKDTIHDKIFAYEYLTKSGMVPRLREIHDQVLGASMEYVLLCKCLLEHLRFTLHEFGWNRFNGMDNDELLTRLTCQRVLYCAQKDVIAKKNDFIVETLFDEGDDIDKFKVATVRKSVSIGFKKNPVIKLYRLKKGDDFVVALSKEHIKRSDLEEFYFYYMLMLELNEYEKNAKEGKPVIIQYVTIKNKIENYGTLVRNEDGGLIVTSDQFERLDDINRYTALLEDLLKKTKDGQKRI